MTEIKILIEAAGLTAAINNLSAVIGRKTTPPVMTSAHVDAQPEGSTEVTSAENISTLQPEVDFPDSSPEKISGYTMSQIMDAAAELMEAGKSDELYGLLRSFEIETVKDLKQEQFSAFATEMRELGATI